MKTPVNVVMKKHAYLVIKKHIWVSIFWYDLIFWEKMKNIFSHFWRLFDNIWYVWPRHTNIHIQKINFASTRNSGSLFSDLYRTFHVHFSERPAGILNVRQESRTFGRNLERSAEIPNIGGPFLDLLWHFSFFTKFPVAHVLQFPSNSVHSVIGETEIKNYKKYIKHSLHALKTRTR